MLRLLSIKVQASLPLTTVATPLMWKLIDLFGLAKILVVFNRYRQVGCKYYCLFIEKIAVPIAISRYSIDMKSFNLGYRNDNLYCCWQNDSSGYSKGSVSSDSLLDVWDYSVSWKEALNEFQQLLYGYSDPLPRTANIIHALGNVTVSILHFDKWIEKLATLILFATNWSLLHCFSHCAV